MTTIKLLSAGLIAAAMLATPAMASENHTAKRQVTGETIVRRVPTAHHFDGGVGNPAPRVGALPAPPRSRASATGNLPKASLIQSAIPWSSSNRT